MATGARRETPPHRLRPNEAVWTPPAVVFFDTETAWVERGPDEIHRLRCWSGVRVDRRHQRKRQPAADWRYGETAAGLAAQVDAWTVGRGSLWCYAHNLGFDLQVSDLINRLVGLGWRLTEFSLRGQTPWARLSRASKTITLLDSWGWLPESLSSLAARMGGHKVDLPRNDDGTDAWWARCAGDVDLLARAVLGLMAWWDEHELGRWSISGPSCGWNAMRHFATQPQHVIMPDAAEVAFDRLAVRGGRKDTARLAGSDKGPWVELDLTAAYPTVAAHLPLPIKRSWAFDGLPVGTRWLDNPFWAPMAECVISTDRPRFPVRHGEVTWYPCGTFSTVLAAPEIRWARELGCLVSIGRGFMHKMGMTLRPWATWVLDPSRGGTVEVPPVAALATKSWGRSVIGKFAARSQTAELLPGQAAASWRMQEGWDSRVGRKGAELEAGGSKWWVTYDGDTESCYPAVLAWVESEVRVRLGRVLDRLGDRWVTCDTDGLILDAADAAGWLAAEGAQIGSKPRDALGWAQVVCDRLAPLVAPLSLRPKRVIESLRTWGPQHMVVDGRPRMAGVRSDARELGPGRFVARDWPGMAWQMAHSTPGAYRRPERTSTFRAPTVHRWVLANGRCWPVEMEVRPDGTNLLLSWGQTPMVRGVALAPVQYPALAKLLPAVRPPAVPAAPAGQLTLPA